MVRTDHGTGQTFQIPAFFPTFESLWGLPRSANMTFIRVFEETRGRKHASGPFPGSV